MTPAQEYHDGWDDLRAWMEELGIEEGPEDVPGALSPLIRHVDPPTLGERLGPERFLLFMARLRQELAARHRQTAALRRHAGLKYENVALLEQAHRDAAEARAGEAHYQKWRGEPPLPDDTPPDESD